MLLCTVLALMTGAAVLAVLVPLSRRPSETEPAADVPFYRAQLAEIDREAARGLLGADEAKAARIESGRRLLRAADAEPDIISATSEPALRRRRAAAALALSVVPIVGLALYGGLGSPQLPDQPIASRVDAVSSPQATLASALVQIEDHLAKNPDDLKGWDVVAPVYLRAGRFADAARAFKEARRLGGDSLPRLLGEGEARVSEARGTVSPEAEPLFRKVLAIDPSSPPARYFVALGAEQRGEGDTARSAYRSLLTESPADAPWVPLVRSRLAGLGEAPPEGAAGVTAQIAASPEIAAMVSGLDERLRAQGGNEQEWSRLVRSFVVLGRRDDAIDRLAKARVVLAQDQEGLARLDRLAGDLGLTQDVAGR